MCNNHQQSVQNYIRTYTKFGIDARFNRIIPDVRDYTRTMTRYKYMPKRHGKPFTALENEAIVNLLYQDIGVGFSTRQSMVACLLGRTLSSIRQQANWLGVRCFKRSGRPVAITDKAGVVRTVWGEVLPVDPKAKRKPATFNLEKKPKEERTPITHTGIKTINLGRGVRNVTLSYSEQGEMSITFEG
tara:strand:+ start:1014 stop:1574 length:561 start_codon:yes stop_codon:yes gene_type:complete